MDEEERVKKNGDKHKGGQKLAPPPFLSHLSCWVSWGLTKLTQSTHQKKEKEKGRRGFSKILKTDGINLKKFSILKEEK